MDNPEKRSNQECLDRLILPFYGLALVLITLVEAVKGLPLTYAQTLTKPTFFLPVVGTALMAAGMLSLACPVLQ
ncbi:hypothetical protein TK06_05910 [Pseudomonas fluorescens]|uniref:Uncharacterized protein n=2 Tax=Pseudomonas TaxID=286 RepID=A0A165YZE4_PSEFL|nr:hypothetical protein TK06_05910 [Pseudomonas fluorescens]